MTGSRTGIGCRGRGRGRGRPSHGRHPCRSARTVGCRYRMPGTGARAVTSESSAFRVPVGSIGWMQPYVSDYEAFYSKGMVGTQFVSGDFGFPGLFQTPGGAWVLLTEADVRGSYGA